MTKKEKMIVKILEAKRDNLYAIMGGMDKSSIRYISYSYEASAIEEVIWIITEKKYRDDIAKIFNVSAD